MLQGRIQTLETERQFALGKYVDLSNSEPVEPTPEPATGPTLKYITDEYWSEKVESWKERTVPEHKRTRDRMLVRLGADNPIESFDWYKLKEYRDSPVNDGLIVKTVP